MEYSAEISSDNPLFRHYGRLAEACFSDDQAPGAPVSVFPKGISGIHTGLDSGGYRTGHLEVYADKEQLAFVQKAVDRLRQGLMAEAASFGARSGPSVSLQFKAFREALVSGREAMLNENPFYELTGLIFRLNQTALKNALAADLEGADSALPGTIKVSRSLRHLWGRDGGMIRRREKVRETLGKLLSVGKIGVGLILFVGSSLTTAKAVSDMAQSDWFMAHISAALSGSAHENFRNGVAVLIGVLFSSVILDFKSRLFQGVAESGRVFAGMWEAFQRFPRWMFLSLFLTAFSIWTNYDGIVLLFSKTQDLAYQWGKIEGQVSIALGDPKNPNVANPNSLADLNVAMERTVADAIVRFNQVVLDEMSGAASSGKADKGPRYWAKYFIVQGGYVPGTTDVTRSYKNSTAAVGIDKLLVESRLDFKTPLEEKLRKIVKKYADEYEKTRENVSRDMSVLGQQMVMKNYSLAELNALFALEAYHVNESVKKVVAQLEANTKAFAEVTQELKQVVSEYVALLRRIDQYGIPTNTQYTIDIPVVVPHVEAIDRLKQGGISEAKRRSLEELRQFLFEVYGTILGAGILGLILFLAVFMDLSDPILYSTMVARWGRRDRHFLEDNQQHLQLWEDVFVRRLRSFFVRPEIRPVMPSLSCPGHLVFHYVFHHHLEEIYPHTKDPSVRTTVESLRFWFAELFSNTRMIGVLGYNNRQMAIRRFIRNREVYAPQLINRLFPGFLSPFTPGANHFDLLRLEIASGMAGMEKRFHAELEEIQKRVGAGGSDSGGDGQAKKGVAFWIGRLLTGSFRGLPDPCPMTRNSWLERVAKMRSGTESSQHYLASFVPILKDWLAVSKFPHLQEATIQPLERLLQGIPNRRMLEEALDLQVAYEQLEQLKRALTDIVGLSMFYGEVLDAAGMQAILSSTDFPEIAEIFLFRRQDISVLEKRLEGIKVKLDSVHYVLRALVENQEAVVEVLTRIRTHHLSPMKVILERMESRSFFEKSLRLDVLFRDLIGMERFMMRLWDALDEEDVSLREQDVVDSGGKGAHANPLLRYLVCSQGASQLTLLDQMGQLEEHADETHKKLNAIVFVLTFVDKLAIKVRGQLEEILDMQHSVIEIDHRNRAMVLGGAAAVERRFLEFMENNRLFFLSLPGRVGTLFEKVDSLLQDPGVAEAHNVELFRGVESRTFKLHQFMKHSLEFFDGRRDRLELPPSFAFSGTVEGDVSGNRVLEGTSLGADSDSPEVIGQTVKRIRTCLREISLAEWDLLKLPIPPQSVMEIFEANRNSIERSWVETERIQSALERGSTEGEPVHFALLGEDARALLNTLDSIQKQVVVLPIVDRRLSSAHAVDPTTGRRLVDKVDDFCKTQVSSRRSMERVVAHHPVELRFPGVGTFKGVIHDVSKTGVCVETDQPPSNGLKQEMDGSIRLISDKQGNKINCRVKRLTGHMLGLAIDEASQAGFSQVVRREITGGKANVG